MAWGNLRGPTVTVLEIPKIRSQSVPEEVTYRLQRGHELKVLADDV